jgi:hypothetical protein
MNGGDGLTGPSPDSLPELVTGLGRGGLHRRLGRRDALLELIDSCGEVHVFLPWVTPKPA